MIFNFKNQNNKKSTSKKILFASTCLLSWDLGISNMTWAMDDMGMDERSAPVKTKQSQQFSEKVIIECNDFINTDSNSKILGKKIEIKVQNMTNGGSIVATEELKITVEETLFNKGSMQAKNIQ